MALEEYIKQVKEIWTNYTLDLVNYQNKCRLIRYASGSSFTSLKFTLVGCLLVVGTTYSTNAARI
jgi:hypothetical protein